MTDNFLKILKKDAKLFQKNFGRPKEEIDLQTLEYLCQIQCTLDEIAGCFRVHKDTIRNRIKEEYGITFSTYREQFASHGKMSLRREQFKQALKGNIKMLVFLGQQYLGQSEKTKTKEEIMQTNIDLSHLSDEELQKKIDEFNELDNGD